MKKKFYISVFLMLSLLLITGCSQIPEPEPSAEPASNVNIITNVNSGGEAVSAEPVSPLFHSIDELSTYLRENGDIDYYYAPDADSLPGYVLMQIEVLQDFVMYYYLHSDYLPADYTPTELLPVDPEIHWLQHQHGVNVCYFTNKLYTVYSISNQFGIPIDESGYVYDEERGDLSFMADSNLVTVRVPDELNDYETIKSLCTMEKISLE